MNLRRRIALLLDPELASLAYGERTLWWAHRGSSTELSQIAQTLKSIDQKMKPKRGRVVECRHPELHPEVAFTPTDC